MSAVSARDEQDAEQIRRRGFVVIESLLAEDLIAEMRDALSPHLRSEHLGRNNFEGFLTERIYSLVAKHPVFADLVEHPRILALCDAFLAPNYLLTASQAIHIHPGETAQAFHTDDTFYIIPRPRPAVSLSTIVAVDPFTTENGATQVVPGSHLWSDEAIGKVFASFASEFETAAAESRRPRPASPLPAELDGEVLDVTMPAGSVIVFLGTLVHRAGANRSTRPRLALSNQYCQPWARQQENYTLGISREQSRAMSERVRQLLGYSIHPPFMGHVNGLHPCRLLE
jgi:ectoine hydroxylase-related dioxygenase (phytanoyl-CoA dioxygenase family)